MPSLTAFMDYFKKPLRAFCITNDSVYDTKIVQNVFYSIIRFCGMAVMTIAIGSVWLFLGIIRDYNQAVVT